MVAIVVNELLVLITDGVHVASNGVLSDLSSVISGIAIAISITITIITSDVAVVLVVKVPVVGHDAAVRLSVLFILRVHLVDGCVKLSLGVVMLSLTVFSRVI